LFEGGVFRDIGALLLFLELLQPFCFFLFFLRQLFLAFFE